MDDTSGEIVTESKYAFINDLVKGWDTDYVSPVWYVEFEYSLISYFWQYHFGVVYGNTIMEERGLTFGLGESDCFYVPNDDTTGLNTAMV